MAGDAEGAFDGALVGFLDDDAAFDEEGLADMGEGRVVVELRGGPDGARLDAAVGESGRFTEVGFAAGAEEERDVVEQGRLVALGGEHEVGAAGAQEVGELAQEGVGGEGLSGEVEFEAVEHGDDGSDLVGALGLVVGADREAVDFFWV